MEICRQITQIIQGVFSVFNITNQPSKCERNDHGRPIWKFIDKLHKLYGVFFQYSILLTKHQKVKGMTKEGRYWNL